MSQQSINQLLEILANDPAIELLRDQETMLVGGGEAAQMYG